MIRAEKRDGKITIVLKGEMKELGDDLADIIMALSKAVEDELGQAGVEQILDYAIAAIREKEGTLEIGVTDREV